MLKTLYNKDWYTPTVLLHKDLKLLQMHDIVLLFYLVLVYQQQNNHLPEIFSYYFTVRENLHTRNIRNGKDLHVNQSRNNYGDKSIKVTGAKLYNRLPQNMKDSKTLCIFKKRVKKNIGEMMIFKTK